MWRIALERRKADEAWGARQQRMTRCSGTSVAYVKSVETSLVRRTVDDISQYSKSRRVGLIRRLWLLGRLSLLSTLQGLANLDVEVSALSKACHQQPRRCVEQFVIGDIRTVHTDLLIRWSARHCPVNCGNFGCGQWTPKVPTDPLTGGGRKSDRAARGGFSLIRVFFREVLMFRGELMGLAPEESVWRRIPLKIPLKISMAFRATRRANSISAWCSEARKTRAPLTMQSGVRSVSQSPTPTGKASAGDVHQSTEAGFGSVESVIIQLGRPFCRSRSRWEERHPSFMAIDVRNHDQAGRRLPRPRGRPCACIRLPSPAGLSAYDRRSRERPVPGKGAQAIGMRCEAASVSQDRANQQLRW
jgi:hypothetical protein